MMIPLIDLDIQYKSIQKEVLRAIEKVLDSKKFIQGEFEREFSHSFGEIHGSPYVVGCSNGTSAITAVLRGLEIGHGDEVITVANSFFATAEAIVEAGARPVFVDCRRDTYGIDEQQIEAAITDRTKAILPVHLYGNPCAMDKIGDIAKKHNLKIIEDTAQGHLGSFKGVPLGMWGDAGTFSFYPGKNLGAYGDAGAIITKNESFFHRMIKFVDHGRSKKYEHEFCAGNYRMDAIQAAVLTVKCKYIREWTEKRKRAARVYNERLKGTALKVIEVLPGAECVYHLFVVEVENRDEVVERFLEKGISTGIHYPIPLHLQPALKYLNYKEGSFPQSEQSAKKILSLPIYPEISDSQIHRICDHLLEFTA